jgi:tRNA-(MS[2]IO[6]A)-hydroxylase (MiaE)-like
MTTDPADAPVIDLLGLIACGELFAFETLARDSALATGLDSKAALGEIACREFAHFTLVLERLRMFGAEPDTIVDAYIPTMTEFHKKTAPRDLLEGLMKAYVGDGIAADFGREIAAYVDPETREFLMGVLAETGQQEFIVPYIQAAIAKDPGAAGRLALWGRRLMGEALAQAQRVAADRPDLAQLVVGGPDEPGAGLAEFANMLARMTESHSDRMRNLGLAP